MKKYTKKQQLILLEEIETFEMGFARWNDKYFHRCKDSPESMKNLYFQLAECIEKIANNLFLLGFLPGLKENPKMGVELLELTKLIADTEELINFLDPSQKLPAREEKLFLNHFEDNFSIIQNVYMYYNQK